jgi:hypothetical protein
VAYRTVFDISQKGFEWQSYGIFLLVIGTAALLIWRARKSKSHVWKSGTILLTFGFVLFLGSLFKSVTRYLRLHHAYEKNEYSSVEGVIQDFQPIPSEGHQEECFSVKTQRFCYSNVNTPGFNKTVSRGGLIKAGLHARIAYIGNDILRLEIADDQLPKTP